MSDSTEKNREELKSNFNFKKKPRTMPEILLNEVQLDNNVKVKKDYMPVLVGVGDIGKDVIKAILAVNNKPLPIVPVMKPGDWVKAEITGTLLKTHFANDKPLHHVQLLGSNDLRIFESIQPVDVSLETILKERYGMSVINWHNESSFYGSRNGTSNTFVIVEKYRKSAFLNFDYKGKEYSLLIPDFIKTIGSECILKESGHVGKIIKKMEGSWGVYWYAGLEGTEHGKRIRESGMPSFWQDINKIEIIIP